MDSEEPPNVRVACSGDIDWDVYGLSTGDWIFIRRFSTRRAALAELAAYPQTAGVAVAIIQ